MSQRIADTLEQARELMKGGNWCRGRNHHRLTGAYCMRGAICQAASGDPDKLTGAVEECLSWVRNFLPLDAETTFISLFNDTHTWEEVDALLARAAEAARQ